jgi:hypothetical protein
MAARRPAISIIPPMVSLSGRENQRHCERSEVWTGHSGAMRSIEPGIQGFPDAQLRI